MPKFSYSPDVLLHLLFHAVGPAWEKQRSLNLFLHLHTVIVIHRAKFTAVTSNDREWCSEVTVDNLYFLPMVDTATVTDAVFSQTQTK